MGDIGKPVRKLDIEPIPLDEPIVEPSPQPAPVKEPVKEPEREPVPA